MRTTIRTTTKAYVLGVTWLIVLAGVAGVSMNPMHSIYAAIGVSDPLLRTAGTLALAMVSASVAVWLLSGRGRQVDRTPAHGFFTNPGRREHAAVPVATSRAPHRR
jgi:hypothetical protein